jgi:hypothetical protein
LSATNQPTRTFPLWGLHVREVAFNILHVAVNVIWMYRCYLGFPEEISISLLPTIMFLLDFPPVILFSLLRLFEWWVGYRQSARDELN